MVRFALVGLVNTVTYYVCYLLLLPWLPYVVAHVVAFLLAMTGSFFLHSRFTYRTRPTLRKFLLFPLSNAANFLITTCGVYLLVDVAHLSSRYAPLIAAVLAIPVTFLVSRAIMLRPDGGLGHAKGAGHESSVSGAESRGGTGQGSRATVRGGP
ncbi:GtrA family protein [Streptomyces sp. NPDC088725]|uniref:GtrA family protein n=1 Tax=Streptomyces sp. NPDC088725 TaxID=3365873 RepID=UPI00382F93E3